MKNLLIAALCALCFTTSAAGQMVRSDSLWRAAAERAAAKTTAQCADEIARLTDCSNITSIIKTLNEKSSSIYLSSRYVVRNRRYVLATIVLFYDPQTDSVDYRIEYVNYTKRRPKI